jgi:hypothetical protein
MKTCNLNCGSSIPNNDWAKACDIATRDGGIPFLTFYKCGTQASEFPNPGADPLFSDIENVKFAICNGLLFVTAELLGQKPKGSFTKRRLTSCGPEKTISGTKTITFQDFNADIDTLIDFDFWKGINDNKNFLQVGWVTCDGRWYQTVADWDLELDEVIEDTKDGKSFYEGVITMSEKDLVKPIITDGLLDVLRSFKISANCY